jgi:hypothetical protein
MLLLIGSFFLKSKIQIDNALVQILEGSDLSSLTALQDCNRAVQKLYNVLNTQLKPGMSSMVAVQYVISNSNTSTTSYTMESFLFMSFHFVS